VKRHQAKPPPEPTQPRLSPCEKAVLELLLRGLSDKLVACELGVTVRAIRRHVQSLHLKFAVHSRLELATKYLKVDRITFDT
jgi:two-component system, NarL family, nitrate/nitrite response regulator NarL